MPKKPTLPIELPDDPLPFRAVVAWCRARGLPIIRCSPYQLKMGPWNVYTKGTFHHDGDSKRRGSGPTAFKVAVDAWLEDEGLSELVKS